MQQNRNASTKRRRRALWAAIPLAAVLALLILQRDRIAGITSSALGLFERRIVALDEPFVLHRGGRAVVRDTSASVRVIGFVNSPCPQNAVCVWSGQAVSLVLHDGATAYEAPLGTLPDDAPYTVTMLRTNFKTFAELVVRKKPQQQETAVDATGDVPWDITLPEGETRASALLQPTMLMATKRERAVTVLQKNLVDGSERNVLRYNEEYAASESGNLWIGLPPSIALAPDGRTIAMNAEGGLRTADLATGASRTLIRQTAPPPPDTEEPPSWPLDELKNVYTLAVPSWSADGRYIAFLEAGYEGAGVGLWDVTANAYRETELSGGYQELRWSPNGHTLLKPAAGAYEGTGLYLADAARPADEVANIADRFGKGDALFHTAAFSPDGSEFAFTMSEEERLESATVGIVQANGGTPQYVADSAHPSLAVFAPDGNALLFLRKDGERFVLVRYDRTLRREENVASLPEGFQRWSNATWTKEGYLTLVGTDAATSLSLGGNVMRFLLLDFAGRRVVYASAPAAFATFAGFLP